MIKRLQKKVIACLTALTVAASLLPQNPFGIVHDYGVEAASASIPLSDDDVDSLYHKVFYERGSVHDPSIIKKNKGYYVFGSHMGVAKTNDLKNWEAPSINGEVETNGYYGIRNDDGSVTPVSYNNAFQNGAYGTKSIPVSGGKSVSVDFSSFPASAWNTAHEELVKGNMWAPDIICNKSNGKYYLYTSLNGSQCNSLVVLLTSDNIEGPYVYEAPIVYTGFTSSGNTSYNKTDLHLAINKGEKLSSLPARYNSNGKYDNNIWPHAIDPFVFYDDKDNLWLGYGSWSGGIYMLQLDEDTGLRDYTVTYDYEIGGVKATDISKADAAVTSDPYFGKKIAGGCYVSGEGAYVEKIGNYYFLFMSYGFYSPTGGYNMRIFRSENPDGPYMTINGNDNAIYPSRVDNYRYDSKGLQLMGNYQWNTMGVAEIAQGHNSALWDDGGNAYVIYHTKFGNDTADHQLRVHQLYLNADGWIVAAPYEYAGEKDTTAKAAVPTSSIAGEYDLIIHQYSNRKAKDDGTIAANVDIVKPVSITLGSDGKITGSCEGTWTEANNAAYATITISGTEYKGVFAEQTIDGTNMKTMCFTAVDSKGKSIWGSKKLNDDTIIAYDVLNLNNSIPSGTSDNLTLDTKGRLGSTITWSSSNTGVLSNDGTISQQSKDTKLVLTGTYTKGNYSYTKAYPITVYGTAGENSDKLLFYDSVQIGDSLMSVPSVSENTGVSLTFDVKKFDSDWTKMFTTNNWENVFLSILNYGGENTFPHIAVLSEEAKKQNSGVDPWQLFLYNDYKVTISYNVDGSIAFYRNGVLMLTYTANMAIGKNSVADLSKAIANAVSKGQLTVQYAMSNLSIGYALDYDSDPLDYLYYEDYERVSDASTVWTSKDAQDYLTIANDGEHGKYLSYSITTSQNSRGAYSAFRYGDSVSEVSGEYTIELDTLLKAGSGNNSQETQFAIIGTDKTYSNNNINDGLTSGYIFKMYTTNSTTWKIGGTTNNDTVIIPNNSWVHIKVAASTENKVAAVTISNGSQELYKGKVAIDGTGNLYGLYNRSGRYYGVTYVDNVKVYYTPTTKNTTASIEGTAYLDTTNDITVTFSTDGMWSKNEIISINGEEVQTGKTIGLVTVDRIIYKNKEITVKMTAAPMNGWHSIQGSYEVALLDSVGDKISSKILQYNLDGLSENSAYAPIKTQEENAFVSGYYKIVGTKMYFMTIVKQEQIHCDGVMGYGWWNGINSQLYMAIGGTKYSVGSHVYQGQYANAITWAMANDTAKNTLIDLDNNARNVVRSYIALGTFDNDDDIDKGCVLLNEVDLADIGYTVDSLRGNTFTLSGFFGPNDGSGRFPTVDTNQTYVIPGYSVKEISGKAYPDKESEVNVTFSSTGTMGSDNNVKINNISAKVGDTVDLATVKDITYGNGTMNVILTMAPIHNWHSNASSYEISLYDSLNNKLATATVEYELAMSDDSKYSQIEPSDNNYTSGYVKIDGTKMYFMTIVKSNKIHCDGVQAGGITYGWSNGINSELYITIGETKYSVGSHVFMGTSANKIWMENQSLIDSSNTVRSFMAFGTFNNDSDTDKGCILLNVVDLKEIGLNQTDASKLIFTLSGFLGPNDGGPTFVTVDATKYYVVSNGKIHVCTRKYTDPTCTEDGFYTYTGTNFTYKEVIEDTALGHSFTNYVSNNDATCSANGTKIATCDRCTETDTIEDKDSKLPHTIVTDKAVPATCTTTGLTEGKHCSVCKEVLIKQTTVDALGHTEVVDKAVPATCTTTGLTEGSHCSVCNAVIKKQETVSALGHKYDAGIVIKQPTVTEPGTRRYTCSVCNNTYDESIDTLTGHEISGTITIAKNKWDSFLTAITFGLYKNSQEEITITAETATEIYYLIATDGKTYSLNELKGLSDASWAAYSNSKKPTLAKNTKNVVYAKLKDAVGNVSYLSSNGIIEDEVLPNITEFSTVAGGLTDSSASFQLETDENATYYFVLYKNSEDKLSTAVDVASEIVANAMKTGVITAGKTVTISIAGLDKATDYNAYVVVKDAAGNLSKHRLKYITTAQEMIEVTDVDILGDAVYGSMLNATASNKENLQDYSFQWYRSAKEITSNTDVSTLTLIGRAEKGNYVVQKDDVGKYLAVTIAIADEVYAGSNQAFITKQVQPKTITAVASVEDKVYDGNTEAEVSEITLDGIIGSDNVTAVAGSAVFENASSGKLKEVTISGLVLEGADSSYYQLEETTIKATASINKSENTPNIPKTDNVWNVSNLINKVKDIELPEDWAWFAEDAGKELPIGSEVKATAIYNGTDKGNYVTESVQITMKRSKCAHEKTEIRNVKQENCTEAGYTGDVYCTVAGCGELVSAGSAIAPLGHSFTNYQSDGNATCTEDGTKTAECARGCGETKTIRDEESKTGHIEEIDPSIAATCTTIGVTEGKHCSVCNIVLVEQEAIPALGHTEVVDPAIDATCTVDGKTEGKHCSVCGEVTIEQSVVPALDHDYGEGIVTKEPTVDEAGIRTFTCSRCGDSRTEEIDKLQTPEHKHAYEEKVTEPTCTKDGEKVYTCSCGDTYSESIKALGHDYDEGIVTKPATYSETGIRTFTCGKCGNSYTEDIPRLTPVQTPSTSVTTPSNGSAIGTTTTPPSGTTEDNTNQNPVVTEPENSSSVVETKPDGTKVETVTEEQLDGTVKETITETKPDGTVKDTITETKTDGTVVSTVKDTKTDGSVTEIKEITVADNSATLATTVETNASGSITVNSVIRTGVSNSSDTISISESLMQEIAADNRAGSVVVEITDVTVKSATTESKQTVVTVDIPVVEGVKVEKIVLTKESIDTAKETGKGLKVNVVSSTKDSTLDNYSVVIPAKQLAKIDASVEEINVTINADRVTNVADNSIKDTVTKVLNKNKGKKKETCVVSLAANEAVNTGMKVTIPVTDKTTIAKGSKVYIYKYDSSTGKLVEVANSKQTVSSDGSVVIAAASGSDYVISAKKLTGSKVETIKDGISVSVSKKTAKVGKTVSVEVSLPDTVSTKSVFGTEKATITYKSSDSKIASVSKSGIVTTKKSGTVSIKTTVKLASGQKVTKEQKITVK